jgi:hypothetical protein
MFSFTAIKTVCFQSLIMQSQGHPELGSGSLPLAGRNIEIPKQVRNDLIGEFRYSFIYNLI